MTGKITESDLREYCQRDPGGGVASGKLTIDKCVEQNHRKVLNDTLISIADCRKGVLTVSGYSLVPSYNRTVSMPPRGDRSCASGMPPLIEQYNLLCRKPSRASATGNTANEDHKQISWKDYDAKYHTVAPSGSPPSIISPSEREAIVEAINTDQRAPAEIDRWSGSLKTMSPPVRNNDRAAIMNSIRAATTWSMRFSVVSLIITRQGDKAIAITEIADASKQTDASGFFFLEESNSKWRALYSFYGGGGTDECTTELRILKKIIAKAQSYSAPKEYWPGFLPGGVSFPMKFWEVFEKNNKESMCGVAREY